MWRETVIRMYRIYTCMRMSKDTFSDKRLSTVVCAQIQNQKEKKTQGRQMCAALHLAQRGFCLQWFVNGECRLSRSQSAESVTGCSATDGPSISTHGPVNIQEDRTERAGGWRGELRNAAFRTRTHSQTHPSHSRCSWLPKNCIRSSQPKFHHG